VGIKVLKGELFDVVGSTNIDYFVVCAFIFIWNEIFILIFYQIVIKKYYTLCFIFLNTWQIQYEWMGFAILKMRIYEISEG